MRVFLILAQITFFFFINVGAKTHFVPKPAMLNPEIKFLDLKLKKELSDKKLTPHRKYTLAILAARELKQLNHKEKALEFYRLANEFSVSENKTEINLALSEKNSESRSVFFYEVNLKQLLKSRSYEKALLSMDPEKLNEPENAQYKIFYDLLNVKIRKTAVKKLYCLDDFQKNPEVYQYKYLMCDMLNEYLRIGKIPNYHIKLLEEYFFKHDLKERYLLQVAKDLKASL